MHCKHQWDASDHLSDAPTPLCYSTLQNNRGRPQSEELPWPRNLRQEDVKMKDTKLTGGQTHVEWQDGVAGEPGEEANEREVDPVQIRQTAMVADRTSCQG